jgi:thioredoxin 1
MSAVRTVTDETFATEVERNPRPVIVEYWAQWCGPCRQVGPVLDAIATEHADVLDVVKINVDENPRTAQKYSVMLVPTVSLFTGVQPVRQVIGARSKSAMLREFADYVQGHLIKPNQQLSEVGRRRG